MNLQTQPSRAFSTATWTGITSSKFNGGRFHDNHPTDELDHLLLSNKMDSHSGGLKFVQGPKTIEEADFKSHKRVYDLKYQKSKIFDQQNLQKLIKIPPTQDERQKTRKNSQRSLKNKYEHIGRSKLAAIQKGQKKTGIYRNFYKSISHQQGVFYGNV